MVGRGVKKGIGKQAGLAPPPGYGGLSARVNNARAGGGAANDGPDGPGAADPFNLELANLPRNDMGNAERFRRRYGALFMVVKNIGWFFYTGTHWSREDGLIEAAIHAQMTAAALREETKALEAQGPMQGEGKDDFLDRLDAARKWASQGGNKARLNAMLEVAAPYLSKDVEDLDLNPRLFNTMNGTVYLPGHSRVEMRKHDALNYITHVSPARWEEDAKRPVFDAFLKRVQPDESVRDFLQRWFGYCLSGFTVEQVLLLFYGQGANGKSTLVELIRWLLGDYAVVLKPESFVSDDRRSGGQATPDLARLPGARLVPASEFNKGARLDESLIKQMTGGEIMPARHLNQGFFDFQPEFKVVLSSNHLPKIRGQEEGIWRRVLLVPFDQVIPKTERDPELMAKLKAEAPGILDWCIDGWREYAMQGLNPPALIRDATSQYREEMDNIGSFLLQLTERAPPDSSVQSSHLYELYRDWAKVSAIDPVSQTGFSNDLSGKGYRKTKSNIMAWRGLKLKDDAVSALRAEAINVRGRKPEDEPPPM